MNARPPSFASWIMSDGFQPCMKEHRRIGTFSASLFPIVQEEAVPDPATPDVSIQLLIRGRPHVSWDYGAGRSEGGLRPGDFVVGPDGVPLEVEGAGRAEFLVLAVPGERLRAAAQDACGRSVADFGRLHARSNRDERLALLLRWLWADTESGAGHAKLFADGALSMIAARLLALSDQRPRASPGGLAPWQIKRVTAAMGDALAEDFGLADLAELAGLSPYHFARAFKASLGVPPHRYQMMLRVDRARDMLAGTSLSVTEIAHACGFASSQHMATVFRRVLGTTPGAYRKEQRN